MRDVGALERALLPAVPEMLGALAVSVAHRASEGPAAGGDFYDAFELAGGRVAVLVGDVSGHGPDALERTNSLRACAARAAPGGALAACRARVRRAQRRGSGRAAKFATAVVAVHDPADGTLTYATAGHPPPILAGRGRTEPITTGSSPPMGVGLRTGLRETTGSAARGTVVCLFTDGLLEARVSDDLMGREELTRFVDELGPEQYADSLLAQVIAVPTRPRTTWPYACSGPWPARRRRATGGDAGARRRGHELGLATRFLEASFDVPEYQAVTVVEALSATVEAAGGAVLEVTIENPDRTSE